MGTYELNRRGFIKQSMGAAMAAGVVGTALSAGAQAPEAAKSTKSVRLGAPVPVSSDDPEKFAQAHRKLGYRAAYCPDVALKDTDRIRAISDACAKHDVVISEVGRWCNLLDADPEKRKTNFDRMIDGLALADAIGALCCVNIAGSYNEKVWYGPHPDNLSKKFFDAIVENARTIIDAVKPKRAKLGYEMMGWCLPDSPDSYLEIIKAVDREAFGVHLDPCNIINSPRRYYTSTDVLNECFDKLGKWIVSCHGKDLTWDVEMNVHFREVIPGTGSIDYTTYLKRIAALPHEAPLMLEHLAKPEEYDQARAFVLETGEKGGISFG